MIRLVGMEAVRGVEEESSARDDERTYDDGFRDGVNTMVVVFLMVLALAIGGGIDAGSIQLPF